MFRAVLSRLVLQSLHSQHLFVLNFLEVLLCSPDVRVSGRSHEKEPITIASLELDNPDNSHDGVLAPLVDVAATNGAGNIVVRLQRVSLTMEGHWET